MRPPEGFNSIEEFRTYSRCVSKLAVGDQVEAYFNLRPTRSRGGNDTYIVSHAPSPHTNLVTLIGRDNHERNTFLIGSNNPHIGFWPKDRIEDAKAFGLVEMANNVNDFVFAFWAVFMITEPSVMGAAIRICKIIKP